MIYAVKEINGAAQLIVADEWDEIVKNCCAVAVREELERAMTDMVYAEQLKSIIREALKVTVDSDFEFGVWKDIIAASLAARCSNMIKLEEKQLRKKIADEILAA